MKQLDTKRALSAITEIAEMKSCTYSLFFEVLYKVKSINIQTRRHTDVYLWMSRIPDGPSIRFRLQNGKEMNWL